MHNPDSVTGSEVQGGSGERAAANGAAFLRRAKSSALVPRDADDTGIRLRRRRRVSAPFTAIPTLQRGRLES